MSMKGASLVENAIACRELEAGKFGMGVTPSAPSVTVNVTNWNNTSSCDCDAVDVAALADVVGVIIKELQAKGIILGTTSA